MDEILRLIRDECAFAEMFGRLRERHDDDMDGICAFLDLPPTDLSICAIEAIFDALAVRSR